jgi:hypothetical protein
VLLYNMACVWLVGESSDGWFYIGPQRAFIPNLHLQVKESTKD